MADVFISYSKLHPEPTKKLAALLEANGYSVWWDTELLPGDQYEDIIVRELKTAKAAIVIWTPDSVKSPWVRSEARRANKPPSRLITVSSGGLRPEDVPPPFDGLHTESIENSEAILSKVANLCGGMPHLHKDNARVTLKTLASRWYNAVVVVVTLVGLLIAALITVQVMVGPINPGFCAGDLTTVEAMRAAQAHWAEIRNDCERSAWFGNLTAKRNLAIILDSNDGPRDSKRAGVLFIDVARSGDAFSKLKVGTYHALGDGGLSKDANLAKQFYTEAAEAGNPRAMFLLAQLLDSGDDGFDSDIEGAAKWLLKAASVEVLSANPAQSHLAGSMSDWKKTTRALLQHLLVESGDYAGAENGIWNDKSAASAKSYWTRLRAKRDSVSGTQ
jgi:hypothetical protein